MTKIIKYLLIFRITIFTLRFQNQSMLRLGLVVVVKIISQTCLFINLAKLGLIIDWLERKIIPSASTIEPYK